MTAPEIACWSAIGALRILAGESADPRGGYDFSSKDIWQSVSQLQEAFATANTVGTYIGVGLVVNGELVECGLSLRRLTGHSPYRLAPCHESAQEALAKLDEHGWTEADIATEVGEPDFETLAGKLTKLWPFERYLATYRRGRRRPGRKSR